jgi:glucose-6-phosphate 1-dehydrogenase
MVVFGATGDLIAYLALPPGLFPTTVDSLASAG